MKSRLLFIAKYFVFWVCAFILAKLAFVIYQYNQSFELGADVWLGIFLNGLKLDLSTAGYFTLLPSLILVATSFITSKTVRVIIGIYTCLLLVVFTLITLVDMEIYKYWGARLDSAPLRFLSKPKETLASTNLPTLVMFFITFLILTWLLFRLYIRRIAKHLINPEKNGFTGVFIMLFLSGLLFLIIRGGFGVAPINTGSVYFSKNAFANHSAINVVWNFGHSLLEGKESHNPYVFYKTPDYEQPLKQLYKSGDGTAMLLNNKTPNIILLVLESFSAKLIEPLGGKAGVTPEFNKLSSEGVLFSRIYSSDSRTDKGLATVISGYPVLEAIPILNYPEKTQNLPFLSASLIEKGYHASFLYGGDVDFANIRSYLINGGFTNIISEADFPASRRTGKWGVPDHYVFDRFLNSIEQDTGRWFKVMLTLTNHEPFELPSKPKFGNSHLTDKFYSAAWYADSCLGDFIRKFKKTPQWDNTLIIMVADHGTRLPDFDDVFEPRKHHIPVLWTGGAVVKDSTITKTGSQADLAVTLLRQLSISHSDYILGKDLLAPDSRSFAFYSYKNGIAMVTDTSGFGYDFITGDYSFSYGSVDTSHLRMAKMLQQYVFQSYIDLSE